MPYGFFAIEQWKRPRAGSGAQWAPIKHFDARSTLTSVMEWIAAEGKPGFFRILQMQRVIWAESEGGKLRLRKWHAGSPESLQRGADAFDRDGGKYPAKKRAARKPKQPR